MAMAIPDDAPHHMTDGAAGEQQGREDADILERGAPVLLAVEQGRDRGSVELRKARSIKAGVRGDGRAGRSSKSVGR